MKLQSQATTRFDRRELQRLAKRTRPRRRRGLPEWIAAGALAGAVIVALIRTLS